MEIHAPKAPHSLKEFLRELVTITAGILIALSLEGVLEWNHHRHLVRESRDNIHTELSENRRELEDAMAKQKTTEQQLAKFYTTLVDLETKRGSITTNLQLNISLADLHRTSWNTAANTSAISYMPYSEVKAYTEVYDLQAKYEATQAAVLNESSAVYSLGGVLDRPQPSDLRGAEKNIAALRARLGVMRDLSTSLDQRYANVLEQKKP